MNYLPMLLLPLLCIIQLNGVPKLYFAQGPTTKWVTIGSAFLHNAAFDKIWTSDIQLFFTQNRTTAINLT